MRHSGPCRSGRRPLTPGPRPFTWTPMVIILKTALGLLTSLFWTLLPDRRLQEQEGILLGPWPGLLGTGFVTNMLDALGIGELRPADGRLQVLQARGRPGHPGHDERRQHHPHGDPGLPLHGHRRRRSADPGLHVPRGPGRGGPRRRGGRPGCPEGRSSWAWASGSWRSP
ncbi:MAG: hypothetical protein M0C28_00655 [Candidatus Moduliflexus flocculans]|nr:hypothetical protein [Candidatus Moduliflexus flocculans]